MRTTVLMFSLIGLGMLSACAVDSGELAGEVVGDVNIDQPDGGVVDADLPAESAALTCRICVSPPPIRRWENRPAGTRIWPSTARKAVTLMTRGSTPGSWRSYGVNMSTGRLAYVYEGNVADFDSFEQINARDWKTSAGFTTGAEFGQVGTWHRPIPQPPGPIGQPIATKTLVAVEGAATRVLATLDLMYSTM